MCFKDILAKKDKDITNNTTKKQKSILWVDDRPENNVAERKLLVNMGFEIIPAFSTKQALSWLKDNEVSIIISDMVRKEGKTEGYVLLDQLRKMGNQTPYIIYAGSRSPEHIAMVKQHGGQGCINNINELTEMIASLTLGSYY